MSSNISRSDSFSFKPIAYIKSPFQDRFGIPRQPGLTKISAQICFENWIHPAQALDGLREFSHAWVVFAFHRNRSPSRNRASVRPPRLGQARVGSLATRSPDRPNPIGLSLVKILSIHRSTLTIEGGDFLDGTPVLDLKPYVPYADVAPKPRASLKGEPLAKPEKKLTVRFKSVQIPPDFKRELRALLAYDPRPRAQTRSKSRYGFRYRNAEVKIEFDGDTVSVTDVLPHKGVLT